MLKMEYINADLKSKDKVEVLKEITAVFHFGHSEIDVERMAEVLCARESLGSTGIGDGIAIPHGKMQGLEGPVISFGRSRLGIPFDSLDGKPAHLFFMIMVPENTTGIHLKLLARLSKMLKDGDFRRKLLNAETAGEIYTAIAQKDGSLQS